MNKSDRRNLKIFNNMTIYLQCIWFSGGVISKRNEKGTPVKIRDCTRSCNPGL